MGISTINIVHFPEAMLKLPEGIHCVSPFEKKWLITDDLSEENVRCRINSVNWDELGDNTSMQLYSQHDWTIT